MIILQRLDLERKPERLGEGEHLVVVADARAEQGPDTQRLRFSLFRRQLFPPRRAAIAPRSRRDRPCRRLSRRPEVLPSRPASRVRACPRSCGSWAGFAAATAVPT